MTYRDLIRKMLYCDEMKLINLDEEISEEGMSSLREGMVQFEPNPVSYKDDRQMNIDDYIDSRLK
tara:strand:+ start:216 stop:410 length:195 start_codon:yes stop_codon:yes gene_type:complete